MIIFLITITMNFVTWKTQMEDHHKAISVREDHLENNINNILESIDEIENRQDSSDIRMVEISTKLSSIETLLLDIKTDLKDK